MFTRESLLASLQGKSVVIPNLYTIFNGWVQVEVNPSYQKLIAVSDARLKTIFTDPYKLHDLHASDFAFFAATWWPKAPYEELVVLLYLSIWLFNWDDEVDDPGGEFAEDLDSAERYRAQTAEFVKQCLGLGARSSMMQVEAPKNKIVASFKEFGEPLEKAYSLTQRKSLLAEITRFMKHTECEQKIRSREQVPSIEEYWGFRMGTSAVGIVVATLEYAMNFRISDTVMYEDARIKSITDETIINVSIINDLLSVKKEIARGCVISIVPIHCASGMSIQSAVNAAVQALEDSKRRFDMAALSLLESSQREPIKYKHVLEWIIGCQRLCVGNLAWSLKTGRYGVTGHCGQEDGSVRFTLK